MMVHLAIARYLPVVEPTDPPVAGKAVTAADLPGAFFAGAFLLAAGVALFAGAFLVAGVLRSPPS
ncbi:hypothetical protein [Paraburkholderia hospita]|uniref:hypothetical protein n=1 Tax=Paraburkholderia hospita TaxID=169430 RepID=UPI001056635D|nr:hypothetical protein [Paraburkholderia hospita]